MGVLALSDQNSGVYAYNMFRLGLEARLQCRHGRDKVGTREADAGRDRHLSIGNEKNNQKHGSKVQYPYPAFEPLVNSP